MVSIKCWVLIPEAVHFQPMALLRAIFLLAAKAETVVKKNRKNPSLQTANWLFKFFTPTFEEQNYASKRLKFVQRCRSLDICRRAFRVKIWVSPSVKSVIFAFFMLRFCLKQYLGLFGSVGCCCLSKFCTDRLKRVFFIFGILCYLPLCCSWKKKPTGKRPINS